jgi:hypothetical protein
MDDKSTTEINAFEKYGDNCLKDKIAGKGSKDRRPQGYVEVYDVLKDGTKKLIGKHNLIVYLGREMLAQRLVNVSNSSATPTKDEFVSWFGLGTGGVDAADPFDPISPTITDLDLTTLAMINASDSTNADYHIAGGSYPETGYYKKPFDTVEFEPDILNDNKWLVIKITVTIGIDDANGYNLSEAGLYSAESSGGGYSGQFSLFARVTFPTVAKTDSRRLSFTWYLYV